MLPQRRILTSFSTLTNCPVFGVHYIADKDSNRESQLKTGEYSAASEHYTRVSLVKVYHLVDGKEGVEHMNSRDWTGKVVLSSLDGQTIKGEIDMTEGGVSIKGPFTANKGKSVK